MAGKSPTCIYIHERGDILQTRISGFICSTYVGVKRTGQHIKKEWIEDCQIPDADLGTYGTVIIESTLPLLDRNGEIYIRLANVLKLLQPQGDVYIGEGVSTNHSVMRILGERYVYVSTKSLVVSYVVEVTGTIKETRQYTVMSPCVRDTSGECLYVSSESVDEGSLTGVNVRGYTTSTYTGKNIWDQPVSVTASAIEDAVPSTLLGKFSLIYIGPKNPIIGPGYNSRLNHLLAMLSSRGEVCVSATFLAGEGAHDLESYVVSRYLRQQYEECDTSTLLTIVEYDTRHPEGKTRTETVKCFRRKQTIFTTGSLAESSLTPKSTKFPNVLCYTGSGNVSEIRVKGRGDWFTTVAYDGVTSPSHPSSFRKELFDGTQDIPATMLGSFRAIVFSKLDVFSHNVLKLHDEGGEVLIDRERILAVSTHAAYGEFIDYLKSQGYREYCDSTLTIEETKLSGKKNLQHDVRHKCYRKKPASEGSSISFVANESQTSHLGVKTVRGSPPEVTTTTTTTTTADHDSVPVKTIAAFNMLKPIAPKKSMLAAPKRRIYSAVPLQKDISCDVPAKITLEEFAEEIKSPNFINSYISQLKQLYRDKEIRYVKLHNDTVRLYNTTRERIEQLLKTGMTNEHIKEVFPFFISLSGLLMDMKCLVEGVQKCMASISVKTIYEGLRDAIHDTTYGLASMIGRDDIKEDIIRRLYAFSRSWKFFGSTFNNYAIMGKPGVGKTAMATVMAYVFCKSGLYTTDTVKIVTRADLAGQYVGHTAPRVRAMMMSCLEGVMFIEEGYSLFYGKSSSNDFGHELGGEFVNFLDKYIGLGTVIVSGYEEEMTASFFKFNKGMSRRFPNTFVLRDYSNEELADIFLRRIEELDSDISISEANANYIYSCIASREFPNQAGDMLNLADRLVRSINSTRAYMFGWEGQMKDIHIINGVFGV